MKPTSEGPRRAARDRDEAGTTASNKVKSHREQPGPRRNERFDEDTPRASMSGARIHNVEAPSLSMRDLQKITAADIAQMDGAVAIRSNGRVVALLMPLNPARPEALAGLVEAVEEDVAKRTPEEQARIDTELARLDADHN